MLVAQNLTMKRRIAYAIFQSSKFEAERGWNRELRTNLRPLSLLSYD